MIKSNKWVAGLYIRLSREDLDVKTNRANESNSITSQRRILQNFVNEHEDIIVYKYYIDDGVSGTTANRPQFQEMIDDIDNGLINCVIVKDSTRFMRNQAEAVNYRDNYFVEKGVRYICVLDGVDRLPNKTKQLSDFITDSVHDMMNEFYVAEGSQKIRASLDARRANGWFIGSHAPYGYAKDPNDTHHLIIDEEAAEVVRMIFKWYLQGLSISNIVRKLNQQGIDNPTYYKKKKGQNLDKRIQKFDNVWSDKTVRRMLGNELYIGTLVQGKSMKLSYKIKKSFAVPEEEQIRTENAHEPIINKNDFERAKSLLNKGGHASPTKKEMQLFSGFVICGNCGHKMSLKTNNHSYGSYRYYRCMTNSKTGKNLCHSPASINVEKLEKTVLVSIQKMANMAINFERVVNEIEAVTTEEERSDHLKKEIEEKEKLLAKKEREKMELFSSYSEGIFTKEDYLAHVNFYNETIQSIKNNIEELEHEAQSFETTIVKQNEFVEHFKKYGKIDYITRPMLDELVDSIVVFSKDKVMINFKFQDVYQRTLEYIQSEME